MKTFAAEVSYTLNLLFNHFCVFCLHKLPDKFNYIQSMNLCLITFEAPTVETIKGQGGMFLVHLVMTVAV